jgi:alpha-N-acetylglucosaminidase
VALLLDLDDLLASDSAFLLGPWLQMARATADGSGPDGAPAAAAEDCVGDASIPKEVVDCRHFYEWNARTQLTTWNPVPHGAPAIPKGPIDYASKHWSGLVSDYYAARAQRLLDNALAAVAAGRPFGPAEAAQVEADFAYAFQVAQRDYPPMPTHEPIEASRTARAKVARWFEGPCGA